MRISLTAAFTLISMATCAVCSTTNEEPLRTTAVLLDQSYCVGDIDLFRVDLSLRLRFENQTDQKLILDKGVGTLYYRIGVARNREGLAAKKFESHPMIDWFFSDKDPIPKDADPKSPDASFVILSPGDSFETARTASVFAQYDGKKTVAGTIPSGPHVLQMELSSWTRPGEPEEFFRKWNPFGRLVTEVLKTEPIEFRVPSNPKVNECKR
jgi:hypothetical protein